MTTPLVEKHQVPDYGPCDVCYNTKSLSSSEPNGICYDCRREGWHNILAGTSCCGLAIQAGDLHRCAKTIIPNRDRKKST